MTKTETKEIILAVGAHPDDIDFGASGTIAKWVKKGATAYYLILTDGSKGSDDPKMTPKKLVKIRKKEQEEAAKILGVKKVFFLNQKDTELVADIKLKEKITKKIRELKPTRVVTMNPTIIFSQERGFINHTDHRAAGLATIDSVYPLARDRLTFPQHERQGLKPHKVKELYLSSFGQGNFVSNITATIDLKIAALKAHKSQVSPETIERIKKWSKSSRNKQSFSTNKQSFSTNKRSFSTNKSSPRYVETFVKLDI